MSLSAKMTPTPVELDVGGEVAGREAAGTHDVEEGADDVDRVAGEVDDEGALDAIT